MFRGILNAGVTLTQWLQKINNPNHLSCCMNLLQYDPMIGIFI